VRVTPALLLLLAACSFDLSRHPSADKPVLDASVPDRSASNERGSEGPPSADSRPLQPDAPPPPFLTWAPVPCSQGTAAAAEASCDDGFAQFHPKGATWVAACKPAGAPASLTVGCASGPVTTPADPNNVLCSAGTAIGGGCHCDAGVLTASLRDMNGWMCRCSDLGKATAHVVCAETVLQDRIVSASAPVAEVGTAYCATGALVSGGCDATTGHVIAMERSANGWTCRFGPKNSGQGKIYAYCLVP
jgi:hypothetical protein